MGEQINVVLLNNSKGVLGSVHRNRDDSYSIFIDANLSYEKQYEIFEHEVEHILSRNFEDFNVQEIEKKAHKFY